MGLHKRKRSPYWQATAIFRALDGTKVRKYITLKTKNKRDAEVEYGKILKSIDDGSYFDKPKRIPTVAEIINRYLEEEVIRHKPKPQIRETSIARNLIIEF